ncbi:MAG: insulinase family protein [Deltaproteobacteria bacterium]|nr:insulinase family protein [Deltaproteobacteria bacterium]
MIRKLSHFILLLCLAIFIEHSVAYGADLIDLSQLQSRVKTFTLSNGIRVVAYRREQAPVFTGQIWVGVGGVNEQKGNTGLAHFLEHMAFKGSEVVGTKDYQKEKPLLDKLESLMADPQKNELEIKALYLELDKLWVDNEFGSLYKQRGATGLNAATSKDSTNYTVSLPKSELEYWCWLESDRLLNPVFRQFYKERQVILEERRMRYENDPGGQLYEALLGNAYHQHPYGLPLIGWPEDLESITPEQMRTFYRRYYRPGNTVISLVGDLDLSNIEPMLEKYFSRIPQGAAESLANIPAEPQQLAERKVEVNYKAQPQVLIGYHKPTYPNIDDFHFAVLHALLAEGRASIFEKELVQEKKIFTALATSEAPGEKYPSLFLVAGYPRAGVKMSEAINQVQAIIDRLKQEKVKESDLVAAKRKVKVSIISSLEDNEGLAEIMGKGILYFGDWRRVIEFYNAVESTSAEDIMNLAKRYLNVENRTLVTLAN